MNILNLIANRSPYQIDVETNSDPGFYNVELFNQRFHENNKESDNEGIKILSAIPDVSYQDLCYQATQHPFKIDLMLFEIFSITSVDEYLRIGRYLSGTIKTYEKCEDGVPQVIVSMPFDTVPVLPDIKISDTVNRLRACVKTFCIDGNTKMNIKIPNRAMIRIKMYEMLETPNR